jgi:hypothetical protein
MADADDGSVDNETMLPKEEVREFPRILWVQTDHELEAENIEEGVAAQNQIHFGKEDGFEVRVVNNLNAYDWLSEEMINFVKSTHQNSKVDLPIYELLRLALLYEHGGVSIRLPNVLLMEGLGWVDGLMQGSRKLDNETMRGLSCRWPGPEMIVIHETRPKGIWYKDDFIAARPKGRLLDILMHVIESIVADGVWPFLG